MNLRSSFSKGFEVLVSAAIGVLVATGLSEASLINGEGELELSMLGLEVVILGLFVVFLVVNIAIEANPRLSKTGNRIQKAVPVVVGLALWCLLQVVDYPRVHEVRAWFVFGLLVVWWLMAEPQDQSVS